MKTSDFYYDLPKELIAQDPLEEMCIRDRCRAITKKWLPKVSIRNCERASAIWMNVQRKICPSSGKARRTAMNLSLIHILSFEDLNAEIKKIVAVLNKRSFQGKDFSRQDAFEKYDKPCMKPLPGGCYTACDYKAVLKVPNNYHIEYDGHYYSVLYSYCGKPAILKATASEIRICDQYNRLICTHKPVSYTHLGKTEESQKDLQDHSLYHLPEIPLIYWIIQYCQFPEPSQKVFHRFPYFGFPQFSLCLLYTSSR